MKSRLKRRAANFWRIWVQRSGHYARRKGNEYFEESSPRHLTIPATSFEVTYARVGQTGIERGATGRQVLM